MNKRSFLRVLGVFLLAALMCAALPAAYAEGASARSGGPILTSRSDADLFAVHADELQEMREDALTNYLVCVFKAEECADAQTQETLMAMADRYWRLYTDLLAVEDRIGEPALNAQSDKPVPGAKPEDAASNEELWEHYFEMIVCDRPQTTEKPQGEHRRTGSGPFGHGWQGNKPDSFGGQQEEAKPDGDQTQSDPYLDIPEEWTEQPVVGLANPWTETDSADTAAWISGVKLELPEADKLPKGMRFEHYRAMEGVAEADWSDGDKELTVRASAEKEGLALSGDYNLYGKQWQVEIDGLTLDCLGDGETVNTAAFKRDGVAFTVSMACGKEGSGLTLDELSALVTALKAEAVEPEAESAEIKADQPDLYAGDGTQELESPQEKELGDETQPLPAIEDEQKQPVDTPEKGQ